MTDKFTTVRIMLNGNKFEILVKPDLALSYKNDDKGDLSKILGVDEIYSEASKGFRASTENLKNTFNTTDVFQIADIIIKKGELQLTTDQRKTMVSDKRKQIIDNISKTYVDPKTKLPHPPLRVEQALTDSKFVVDPFKKLDEQLKIAVEQIRIIIPLSSEGITLQIHSPAVYVSQTINIIKTYGELYDTEWKNDGSMLTFVNIPVSLKSNLCTSLNSLSKGTTQITEVEK